TGATGRNTPSVSGAAVAGGVVYYGSGDGKLYAFSAAAGAAHCSGTPKTCKPLWTGATGNSISSTPAVAGGVAYIASLDGNLYALRPPGTPRRPGTAQT